MKKLHKNEKGFTLAELLIVVAIIGVLVAISIPIFTAQLEKSREAVDLANARVAYAEVQAAGLTETSNADLTAQNTDKITYEVSGEGSSYVAKATVTYVQSDQTKWETSDPSVGGIAVPTTPGTGCVVTYTASTGKTTITAK